MKQSRLDFSSGRPDCNEDSQTSLAPELLPAKCAVGAAVKQGRAKREGCSQQKMGAADDIFSLHAGNLLYIPLQFSWVV